MPRDNSVKTISIRLLLALLVIITLGTIGFLELENLSLVDSLYMTIITITTTGFGEVKPLSPLGRMFTIILMFLGIGVFFYAITQIFPVLVERRIRGRRRLIKNLKNHVIVCGYGSVGTEVVREISKDKKNKNIVIIDKDPEKISLARENDYLAIQGDVTSEEVLDKANIRKANFLITCVEDSSSAFCIMTAREFNSNIYAIAIARETSNINNLKRSGANQVLSPYHNIATKVDILLNNPVSSDIAEVIGELGGNHYFEKARVNEEIAGTTIRELSLREKTNTSIIAIGRNDDIKRPDPDMELKKDDQLFLMGSEKEVEKAINILAK
ncbi:potassium channel protein [archaeon SCG-AAA382B04]|nr:potassium channel protein [archaeon SCG-AAA382B04]